MTTQPIQPKPNAETLALLTHLVDLTDANNTLLTHLVDKLDLLLDITANAAAASHATTETLTNMAAAMSRTLSPTMTAAAAQAPAGEYADFMAESVLMSYDDKGAPTYKICGGQYRKFGVRIWPETLPALGIDPATLKPGPNPYARQVRAIMGDTGPRKVICLTPPG